MENAKKGSENQTREFTGGTMLTTEPPDHTRLRRPTVPRFSPKAMNGLSDRIDGIADRLLDAVAEKPEWDLMHDFADPLPMLVMSAVLGIGQEHEDELMEAVGDDNAVIAIDPRASQETLDEFISHGERMSAYVQRLVDIRRRSPLTDDLLGDLIQQEQDGNFSTAELLATVHLMLEAGHVTTLNLIGNGIKLLLDEPDRFALLRDDPDLIRPAVEECMRLEGPVHFAGRIALRDVELRGRTIGEGEIVMLLFPAANRDPEQFADPHDFIIDRSPNVPTGFGAGLHMCIGANLARAETAGAFRRITDRFPDLRIVGTPRPQRTFELRGFRELRVSSQ
jgi:cytochrome P450